MESDLNGAGDWRFRWRSVTAIRGYDESGRPRFNPEHASASNSPDLLPTWMEDPAARLIGKKRRPRAAQKDPTMAERMRMARHLYALGGMGDASIAELNAMPWILTVAEDALRGELPAGWSEFVRDDGVGPLYVKGKVSQTSHPSDSGFVRCVRAKVCSTPLHLQMPWALPI